MARLSQLLFFASLFGYSAFADYPSAKLNQNVCSEIQSQTDRLVPKSDWICVAADGNVFLRPVGVRDFYHGFGHWSQIRTEISPSDLLKINLRTVVYSGSSSEGYTNPSGFFNLVSFKAIWPEPLLGGTLSARVIDLDRQTVGTGLFIEDKESVGGILLWDFETVQWMIRHDSTGMFLLADDVWNFETRFLDKNVGIGTVIFNTGDQGNLDHNRKPYDYVFASVPLDVWKIEIEAGQRNSKWAGLLGLKVKDQISNLTIDAGIQSRFYQDQFAEDIAGMTENQYVSYDQYDKPYTNSMNAFAKDDNLNIYSLTLNLKYSFNHFHRIATLNELVQFAYKDISTESKNFYRLEYAYFPLLNREDSFVIFVSNKILTQSYFRPPELRAVGATPLFDQYDYAGFEGIFRF